MKIVSVVGRKNSGKTTLIERMIPVLRAQGLRVAVVKHDAHDFSIDREGKDTWRFRQAGAEEIVIASSTQMAYMRKLEMPVEIEDILDGLQSPDLVILEGYKRLNFPKLVILRDRTELVEMNLDREPTVIGYVLRRTPNANPPDSDIPRLGADEIDKVAAFVLENAVSPCVSDGRNSP